MNLFNDNEMKEMYDEDYFERGVALSKSGYSNFRWIPELTIPMCARLSEKLKIKDTDVVLDFGCAKGYMVKGFRLIGKQAWGVDVSDYALRMADEGIKQYLYKENFELQDGKKYNWIIAKDVLEHISHEEIDNTIKKLAVNCQKLFCCLPLGQNNSYFISSYNLDITHCIKETLEWWIQKFKMNGFEIEYADYHFDILKANYSIFENGNGFFVLKSKDKND